MEAYRTIRELRHYTPQGNPKPQRLASRRRSGTSTSRGSGAGTRAARKHPQTGGCKERTHGGDHSITLDRGTTTSRFCPALRNALQMDSGIGIRGRHVRDCKHSETKDRNVVRDHLRRCIGNRKEFAGANTAWKRWPGQGLPVTGSRHLVESRCLACCKTATARRVRGSCADQLGAVSECRDYGWEDRSHSSTSPSAFADVPSSSSCTTRRRLEGGKSLRSGEAARGFFLFPGRYFSASDRQGGSRAARGRPGLGRPIFRPQTFAVPRVLRSRPSTTISAFA